MDLDHQMRCVVCMYSSYFTLYYSMGFLLQDSFGSFETECQTEMHKWEWEPSSNSHLSWYQTAGGPTATFTYYNCMCVCCAVYTLYGASIIWVARHHVYNYRSLSQLYIMHCVQWYVWIAVWKIHIVHVAHNFESMALFENLVSAFALLFFIALYSCTV